MRDVNGTELAKDDIVVYWNIVKSSLDTHCIKEVEKGFVVLLSGYIITNSQQVMYHE